MQAIRYDTNEGKRNGLLIRVARTNAYVVLMEMPIRLRKVPKTETRYMEDTGLPPKRVAKQLRAAAKEWGMPLNKQTKKALRG